MAAYLTRFRPVQKLVLRTPAIYEPASFYTQHQYIDKISVRTYRRNIEALKKHPLFLQDPVVNASTLLVVHGKDESVPPETTDVYKLEFAAKTYLAKGFVHAFRDSLNPQEEAAGYYKAIVDCLLT